MAAFILKEKHVEQSAYLKKKIRKNNPLKFKGKDIDC